MLIASAERATYDPDVASYWMGRVLGFVAIVQARLERDQAAGRLDPAPTPQIVTWMVERNISVHCRLDAEGTRDDRPAADLSGRSG